MEFLKKTLDMQEWKNRIKRLDLAFFRFVANWAKYVVRVTSKDSTPWHDIPGYVKIVKAVLFQMKKREIKKYPDALKEACSALLANENMLTAFVSVMFNKTP